MYDVHLGLIEKRVVDFLLVLNELFSLGVKAEVLRAIIGSKSVISLQRRPVDAKFQVEVVTSHQPFFQKTRLNDFSYGVKIWTVFFRFVTIHAFGRQTNRRTDGQNSHR